jgi:hypothetical protein
MSYDEGKKQINTGMGGQGSTVVDIAHRAFYDHEDVRMRLKLWLDENTPYTEHQLNSALFAAGVENKLDRERVTKYLRASNKFREELA